jgi:nucleoid-associated protein YgaU
MHDDTLNPQGRPPEPSHRPAHVPPSYDREDDEEYEDDPAEPVDPHAAYDQHDADATADADAEGDDAGEPDAEPAERGPSTFSRLLATAGRGGRAMLHGAAAVPGGLAGMAAALRKKAPRDAAEGDGEATGDPLADDAGAPADPFAEPASDEGDDADPDADSTRGFLRTRKSRIQTAAFVSTGLLTSALVVHNLSRPSKPAAAPADGKKAAATAKTEPPVEPAPVPTPATAPAPTELAATAPDAPIDPPAPTAAVEAVPPAPVAVAAASPDPFGPEPVVGSDAPPAMPTLPPEATAAAPPPPTEAAPPDFSAAAPEPIGAPEPVAADLAPPAPLVSAPAAESVAMPEPAPAPEPPPADALASAPPAPTLSIPNLSPPPESAPTPAPEPPPAPAPEPSPAAMAPPIEPPPAPEPAPAIAPTATPEPAPAPAPAASPAPAPAPEPGDIKPLPNAGRRLLTMDAPLGEARPVETVTVAASASRAAPVAAAVPISAESFQVEHVVQRGENFWTISKLYYGSGRFYKALWKANSRAVKAPDALVVGDTIAIPPPESLDRKLIDPPGGSVASAGQSTVRDPATRKVRGPDGAMSLPVGRAARDVEDMAALEPESPRPSHVVRDGETLRSIARDRLGNSRREAEIRQLNLDVMADEGPVVGQRLRLPTDATATQRR